MNGDVIVLDTNIVLYLIGGKFNHSNLPLGNYCISVVTELELLSYPQLELREENKIKEFIKEIDTIEFNTSIKEEAILLRKKYSIKLPDSIICATAKHLNATLITCDKDLMRVKEIKISNKGC